MGRKKSAKLAGVSSHKRKSERRNPPLPKAAAPWLVIPYQVKGNKQNLAFYNICEPNNKTSRKFIPELSGKSFWQKHSFQGWLIVICDDRNYKYASNWDFGDCFLWNPASLETIQLPSLLPWYHTYEYELLDCALSITYPDNADDEQKILMPLLLFEGDDSNYDKILVFCLPEDKQWRTKRVWSTDTGDISFTTSLCCFKDKLNLISLGDKHLRIDKGKLWDDDDESLTVKPFETTNNTGFPWRGSGDQIDYISFFVESSNELFNVQIRFNKKQNIKVFNSVVVLRLDFSSMEWKVVTCLGDHVLFISEKTRACCSATKLGLATGCLYYTFPQDQGLYKFEVQSSRNSVILPCLKLPKLCFPSGWIMIPDGRQQQEEEDWTEKAVEKESSIIVYEKNENEKDGGFQETCTPWDILNADSKELVASYLHPLDYVQFRSTCKPIRAMMPVSKPTFATTGMTKTSYLFPWMVFCRDNNDSVYNFLIPVGDNENYLIKFSDILLGAKIRFQKDGWLLMSREEILFFYNPFTRETINLPHLPEHNFPIGHSPLPKHYFCSSICFSSWPTSADCTVFAIDESTLSDPRTITVYSITRGKQDWDIFNFNNAIQYRPLCNPPVLHQGAFYCVDYNELIGTFNLEDNTWKVHGTPCSRYSGDTHPYPSFLVKSGEDLLLVKLGCQENLIRIYKLNIPVMDWVEVESLGKHMLFISHTSCVSAIAPNSEMENKIYFPRLCFNGERILFYSLETGRYDSFGGRHSSKNLYDTEGWRENCTWIEPNWTKFTPQELNWFEPPF